MYITHDSTIHVESRYVRYLYIFIHLVPIIRLYVQHVNIFRAWGGLGPGRMVQPTPGVAPGKLLQSRGEVSLWHDGALP